MLLEQDGGTLTHENREANAIVDELAKIAKMDLHNHFNIECILTPNSFCTKLIMYNSHLGPNFQISNGTNSGLVTHFRAMLRTLIYLRRFCKKKREHVVQCARIKTKGA